MLRSVPLYGSRHSIGSVSEEISAAIGASSLEGVTFSGGEPMQQVHALVDLMTRIRAAAPAASMGMFTGYRQAELNDGQYATRPSTSTPEKRSLWQEVRGNLDFAIMGRYDRTQPGTAPLRTSTNQKLVLFSSRYREQDFVQQFVEVVIDPDGKGVITGFLVLGSPVI